MAKFELATNERMKTLLFNLTVALRRTSFASKKSVATLEQLLNEGNKRDIDTTEVAIILQSIAEITNYLQYIQETSAAATQTNQLIENTGRSSK